MAPFRGLRYAADRVGDLAAVTSPPYDVIDPDDATHLAALDPHNVVRLILPREPAGSPSTSSDDPPAGGRYAQAAALLAGWSREGVLVRDPLPAYYVYEQSGPGVFQRGLLAAVGLQAPEDRVVLAHEDVMPGPVADRLELMRATAANLEPILLTYDGGEDTAAILAQVSAGVPTVHTRSEDGLTQRVWALTQPDLIAAVAQDLAPRQALIADGHHRWATYRRLQAERHAAGEGPGPWDRGLAMLVDSRTSPLQVSAIHRVVRGLSLADALASAGEVFQLREAGPSLDSALDALAAAAGPHPFVVTDGADFHLLAAPEPAALRSALPADRPARWRALDVAVLHALLLECVWRVPDEPLVAARRRAAGSQAGPGPDSSAVTGLRAQPAPGRVGYLHDPAAAVRAAVREGGVAVLTRPVTTADVLDLAASGQRMPRKSTSFGPKPRSGLVLRLLDSWDDAASG